MVIQNFNRFLLTKKSSDKYLSLTKTAVSYKLNNSYMKDKNKWFGAFYTNISNRQNI